MERRTLLIFSLIISVVSLLYLLFSYFGFIRYFKLYYNPLESYVNNYTKLDKADKDRVVIAFSAEEKDFKNLKPFINSILDQTVRVDDIAITIPYKDTNKVPEELKKVLSVNGYSKDYEDAANLVCSVLREPENNTKIIIVEPNMIYGQDFVETMVDKSNEKENKAKVIFGSSSKEPKRGILIKPQFFDDTISKYQKGTGNKEWLNKCCKAKGICIEYNQVYPVL